MTTQPKNLSQILTENAPPSSLEGHIKHAVSCSRFLQRILQANDQLFNDLISDIKAKSRIDDALTALKSQSLDNEEALNVALRQLRQRVLAYLITTDLSDLIDMHEVVRLTTRLAEVAIDKSVSYHYDALAQTYGIPRDEHGVAQKMIVVGMGKLGGEELNVSSDIDLIFAYDSVGETDGTEIISNQKFFTQLSKKVIASLDDITAHGFVFRVDMQLRPFGSEGAIINHIDALENYYQQFGREWERYAWIKGRVITGSDALLTKILRPFIYRRYLDFNAYSALRDLKAQINRDVMQRGLANNIKLGRGGIREIEFIVQLFQLIRGGQDADLQNKSTLKTLAILGEKDLLPSSAVTALRDSYIYLRNLEHRLMYIDDQQTQDLPQNETQRSFLLKMLGQDDWDVFMAELDQHRHTVREYFDATFNDDAAPEEAAEEAVSEASAIWLGTLEQPAAVAYLSDLGYEDALTSYNRLQMLQTGKRFQRLPEQSQQRLHALMPKLIHQAAEETAPDTALLRVMNLLETICGRASYLALLAEFPDALKLVTKLCASGPWLAQYLASHPILLDELLNEEVLYAAPDFELLRITLEKKVQQYTGDVEAQMDAMRHFKHANTLHVAAQDMMANLPLEQVSDYLSELAQLILDVSLQTIWQCLPNTHQEKPHFAVIGYGKLGGKELGYVSDLDIIFLFDDTHPDAAEHYAKFAQRINNWFNSITNAGMLYETDLQLRPDGNSGLLVSSVSAFEQYQLNKAWVWEHQAITRARFVAGDEKVGAQFDAIRERVMTQKRDAQTLRDNVATMRKKMRESHRPKLGVFDVKQDAGGIIDVEFIVQYLVLLHAKDHQALIGNIGNIGLLSVFAKLGLIDAQIAVQTADAYRAYRAVIHQSRLQEQQAKVPIENMKHHRDAVLTLWQSVMEDNN